FIEERRDEQRHAAEDIPDEAKRSKFPAPRVRKLVNENGRAITPDNGAQERYGAGKRQRMAEREREQRSISEQDRQHEVDPVDRDSRFVQICNEAPQAARIDSETCDNRIACVAGMRAGCVAIANFYRLGRRTQSPLLIRFGEDEW